MGWPNWQNLNLTCKSSHRVVFLGKDALKICSKYRRTPMPKCHFNKVALQLPVNLLLFFRTPFHKNTSGWLLLNLTLTQTKLSGCFQFDLCSVYVNFPVSVEYSIFKAFYIFCSHIGTEFHNFLVRFDC